MLTMWSDDVTLFTDGPAALEADDIALLAAAGIPVEARPVAALQGPGEELSSVELADGSARTCEGLLLPVTLHQRSTLATQLGAATAPETMLAADATGVDATFATDVPGLFAAGDVTPGMPSVANAIAAGSGAAAAVVHRLVEERHRALR
jgi:thioredoxin reductase